MGTEPICLSLDFSLGPVETHYYRPQRSCEGYVFTGVCLSTGGGGPGPREGLGGVCSWGGAWSQGVWSRGRVCLVPWGVWSQGVWSQGGCLLWGVGIPACNEADTPPPPNERRLWLRTVRILLECILVINSNSLCLGIGIGLGIGVGQCKQAIKDIAIFLTPFYSRFFTFRAIV